MGTSADADRLEAVLSTAREAATRADWAEAASLLRPHAQDLDADALEVLAESEWWLGQLDACIDLRQQAYQRCVAAGRPIEAARIALTLVGDYDAKNASSQAQGWHRRALRLLKDVPEGPAHGYALLQQVWQRYRREAPQEAIELASRASDVAARHGDADLQALALMALGRVQLHGGETDEGMGLIEEACAAAVGGELTRHATGVVFCQAIITFSELTDYGRAGEWADAATRWCERQAMRGFPGLCRIHRAEVMRLRGAWAQASAEAELACKELAAFAPGWCRAAFRELALIRLRLGDLAGAEQAVEEARALGSSGHPSLALVWIAQGRPQAALAGLQAAISNEDWTDLDRAPCLVVLVQAATLVKDLTAAEAAATELEAIASRFQTPVLGSYAAEARGRVELASGRATAAMGPLRRAIQAYGELDLPFDAATARVLLARAQGLVGEPELAAAELRTAAGLFRRLGAGAEAESAEAALSELARTRTDRRTFMVTDICGSTPLVEALGDAAWSDLVDWHDATLRGLFVEHGGDELDHTGDGFFVAFPDADAAVRCAVALQRRLAQHRRDHGFAPEVRIGIHEADVAKARGRFRGKGMHTAARIGASAAPGEILASARTLDGLTGVGSIERPRSLTLKGLAEPVEVAAVAWR